MCFSALISRTNDTMRLEEIIVISDYTSEKDFTVIEIFILSLLLGSFLIFPKDGIAFPSVW